jgi:hypothetical protein
MTYVLRYISEMRYHSKVLSSERRGEPPMTLLIPGYTPSSIELVRQEYTQNLRSL